MEIETGRRHTSPSVQDRQPGHHPIWRTPRRLPCGTCSPWLTGVNGTLMAHTGVGLFQDGVGCGYPVASASLSRSGPRAGGKVEHHLR
jgi:hypothetical protein